MTKAATKKKTIKTTKPAKAPKAAKPAKVETKSKAKAFEEKMAKSLDDAEEEIEALENAMNGASGADESKEVAIKASKPISQIKKGDKMKVDALTLEVDSHYVMIDHGSTKEMAIELFDSKTDKDYQLRYFSDQVETSLEFYELQEIIYMKRPVKAVEW